MKPGQLICPLCQDRVDKLVYRFHYDSEQVIIQKIREEFPEWAKQDGLCSRCVDFFRSEILVEQRMLPGIGPHFPIKTADDFIVIPTGLRLNADPRFTGKGVTICFIDSGFYVHPDLIAIKSRIKRLIDLAGCSEVSPPADGGTPIAIGVEEAAWHGTMTSVVCAGDGYLSKGLYKGIASDAELVLLKVQDTHGKITTANIAKALKWVLENHVEFNIRIVNISLGADENVSFKESEVDSLAEQLIQRGIVVVAAVGNDVNSTVKPPANSLNVIAVGGIDDANIVEGNISRLYHSSFGRTKDDLSKPELTAHAMWIAAPILPGTNSQKEAQALYFLAGTATEYLRDQLRNFSSVVNLDKSVNDLPQTESIRGEILKRIRQCKYISPHYMHVDGTSFAAPIVTSVIAQLLEVNPELTPLEIRSLLFSTAKRINDLPAEPQGFGLIQPRKVILKALKKQVIVKSNPSPDIDPNKKSIGFYVQHDCATQITLAGSFNQWASDVLYLEAGKDGLWHLEIPMLAAGRYQYKFLVDGKTWIEDFDNPYREPDGFNGFNSILMVESN
jgi:serine protease AprX